MEPIFSWHGIPVRMTVPDRSQIAAWEDHLAWVATRALADDEGDDGEVDWGEGDEPGDGFDIVVEVDGFTHAVWWLDPADCQGPDGDSNETMQCACGPKTLLDVLHGVAVRDRDAVVAAHRAEMTRAFDHYWSGDAVMADSALIHDACPGCLTEGAPHVSTVGSEAETLAIELGYALAAFHHDLTLGAPRYGHLEDGPR